RDQLYSKLFTEQVAPFWSLVLVEDQYANAPELSSQTIDMVEAVSIVDALKATTVINDAFDIVLGLLDQCKNISDAIGGIGGQRLACSSGSELLARPVNTTCDIDECQLTLMETSCLQTFCQEQLAEATVIAYKGLFVGLGDEIILVFDRIF